MLILGVDMYEEGVDPAPSSPNGIWERCPPPAHTLIVLRSYGSLRQHPRRGRHDMP